MILVWFGIDGRWFGSI